MDKEIQLQLDKKIEAKHLALPKKLCWYALRVTALHEKKIRDAIAEVGLSLFERNILNYQIETWVAIKREKRKWSDRIKEVDVVMIPGIVFVRLRQVDKQNIYVNPHIKGFVFNKSYRMAEPIPEGIMSTFIQEYPTNESFDISMREPEVGMKVKMLTGSLRGIVGRLVRNEGQNKFKIHFSELTFSFIVDKEKFAVVDENETSDPIDVRMEAEPKTVKSEMTADMSSMSDFEAKSYQSANAKFHRQRKKELQEKNKSKE